MGFFADDNEIYLFNEGTNSYAYKLFGCHRVHGDYTAMRFVVYAPNAKSVSVVGDFNDWNINADKMIPIDNSGIWQVHIGHAKKGDVYKYAITTQSGDVIYKADPYAIRSEFRPDTASIVWELEDFEWNDDEYLNKTAHKNPYTSPMSIYEVHVGSWDFEKGNFYDLSTSLVDYVSDMGYTHIELMPICEFPLDDSWGYQVTGYYSISSRYGTPDDFKRFVNACHERGIGVIVDWVPAHFTNDAHGLRRFDGGAVYENPDPKRSEQPQWGTTLFDFSKPQVRSFLISNAVYLMKEYHVDGLRVDAVSCMLYLDYGKEKGQWLPNKYGGNENLDAIAFFRQLSKTIGREFDGKLLIAEESTAFPLVTKPPEVGGLGFNFKWNMGYMNDTLDYMATDPLFRKGKHSKLTFSMMYAFSENFILPFSHDEVVHGKRSLIGRMPGSYDEQFAQLRLLYMYQYAHPGKKLMFMGSEFGQFIEWNFRQSIDFCLLKYPRHSEMKAFVRRLNKMYSIYPQFYARDTDWSGFEWLIADDRDNSVIAFERNDGKRAVVCVINFTSVKRENYRIRLKRPMKLAELLNSDAYEYGGNGSEHGIIISKKDEHGDYIEMTLSGYTGVYLLEC